MYTRDIENILVNLAGPLDVTYTISPDEVMSNLEAWRPAIVKEVKGVEVAIERLLPGTEERERWFNTPRAQRLPMKFVFTVKPNSAAVATDASTWYKRKARLVICGNMAAEGEASLYAETAPAEVVRGALAISSRNTWAVAILDVVAAFLRTPLGRSSKDPVVIAQPPRLLEALGLCVRYEMWGLVRALYGLREAPTLWGGYRDDVLQALSLPRGLKWKQGRVVTAWWTVRDSHGQVCAIVVVYVDDFMLCGPRHLVEELGSVIQEVWETSDLTFLGPDSMIRFLGMEIQRATETNEVIKLSQQGYISELLRLHEIREAQQDRIPITKGLAVIPDGAVDVDLEMTKQAQQITGEVLWIAQRTRPDLSYTTCIMASLCTKCPAQTLAIGRKVLGYLQRTMNYTFTVSWSGGGIAMFCDAAFAPQGKHSHGGWVVKYGGVPLVWRSGRQSTVSLSTAESELLSMLDGAVAAKGVEAILTDISEEVEGCRICSDSTSALSISSGSCSWRTRHLRIKASWLHEQISNGLFTTEHCPGAVQPADLLTKALSAARMESLLRLWGVSEEKSVETWTTSTPRVSSKALIALICCLMMISVRAAEVEQGRSRGSGMQVDWDMAGILMILLMLLGALMVWEGIRWSCLELYYEWSPGASSRKLRRLRKLQAATTAAIEKELQRLQSEEEPSRQQSSSTSSSVREPHNRVYHQESPIGCRKHLHDQDRVSGQEETTDTGWGPAMTRIRTPSPQRRSLFPPASPITWSPTNDVLEGEAQRVCHDVCMLMTCEYLREGLRTEGLQTSGLKDDQARRLGSRLLEIVSLPSGPTIKQIKYVLWLWRTKDMSGRHVLRYHEINDKSRISALIHAWKQR